MARAQYMGDPGYPRAMPGTGYAGDPGFFGFLGKVAKGITGAAGKILPGPFGSVARGISSLIPGQGQRPRGSKPQRRINLQPRGPSPTAFQLPQGRGSQGRPKPGPRGAIERALPWGKTGYTCDRPPPTPLTEPPPWPTGYKPNKTSYFLKSGQFIEAETVWVRNRRRNPLNPRAFDKALGRIESAKKFGSRLGRVTIRKKC